ncbi:unnamed protein product [Owenia fusiformis]|uniref:Uncharacterized protein n=1 Tax=Owenia fusiformis TaxID=6347 RepID=A0A8S4N2Q5_OWEFU|nr:unnamed protein product [Owenia fusiformis]
MSHDLELIEKDANNNDKNETNRNAEADDQEQLIDCSESESSDTYKKKKFNFGRAKAIVIGIAIIVVMLLVTTVPLIIKGTGKDRQLSQHGQINVANDDNEEQKVTTENTLDYVPTIHRNLEHKNISYTSNGTKADMCKIHSHILPNTCKLWAN